MVRIIIKTGLFLFLLMMISAADFSGGKYEVWTSAPYHCSIEYPSGWKVQEIPQQFKVTFTDPATDSRHKDISFETRPARSSDTSLQELHNSRKWIYDRHGKLRNEGHGRTKAGLEYYWFEFAQTHSRTKPIKPARIIISYLYIYKGYVHNITAQVSEADLPKYRAIYHHCGKSLRAVE